MKKTISLLLLFLGIVFLVPGQTSEPIDLVLVLDTSSSMSGSSQAVTDYVTGPFLREFLRIGDTFHLISFSGTSRSEISRRIEGVGDVETLIGRLFLMFPVDPYSDIAGALDYTERYVTQLPSSRPKKVVFITDGDQSPQPGSANAAVDSAALENRISETAARLRRNGADFNLVKFPLVGSGPSSGRPSRTAQAAPRPATPAAPSQQPSAQPSVPAQPQAATPQQQPAQSGTPVQPQAATPQQPPAQSGTPAQPQAATPQQQPTQSGTSAQPQAATPQQQPAQSGTPAQPQATTTPQQAPAQSGTSAQPQAMTTPQQQPTQSGTSAQPQATTTPQQAPAQSGTPAQPQAATPQQQPAQSGTPAQPQAATPQQQPAQSGTPAQPQATTTPQQQPAQSGTPVQPQATTTPQQQPAQPNASAQPQAATPQQQPAQSGTPAQPRATAPQTPSTQPNTPVQRTVNAGGFNYLPLIVGLGIAVILILGLIIFFMTRRLNASPNRAMAYMSGRSVSSSPGKQTAGVEGNTELLKNYADGQRRGRAPASIVSTTKAETVNDEPLSKGPVLLSLVVDDQSMSIGRRNTHSLKAGNTYTIGGSKSDDFLIFLVPMPAHLGELQFNGRQCTFTPKKARYFPEIGSQPVPNCIGKTIRVISDKRYELTFHFERYEDPLDSLNRLLNSINLPPKLPERVKKS